jgi:hypothetical protein
VRRFSLPTTAPRVPRHRGNARLRLAAIVAAATLFFAGATLAAGAGDVLVGGVEPEPTTAAAEPIPDEVNAEAGAEAGAAPEDPAASEGSGQTGAQEIPPPASVSGGEAPATVREAELPDREPPAPPASPIAAAASDAALAAPGPDPAGETPAPQVAPGGQPSPAPAAAAPKPHPPTAPPRPRRHEEEAESRRLDRETEAFGGFAAVWLHRTLPDPTPPASRLAPDFARLLARESRGAGVDWALVLGALRADGNGGRSPTGRSQLRALATSLHRLLPGGERQAFLALGGRRAAFADRAMALANYSRAVGLRALVGGLRARKTELEQAVLADPRLDIYGAGRRDIAAGRIDVRVVAVLRYLAEAHGRVTVSSLQSGHRLYASPGVVSAHVYGLAADITSLGGFPIMGNSQPGGVTEHGVRTLLLLPAELRPRQVISLLGLGGPSFPLANHADHIHVGY